jgi:hypothetical protein
MERVDQVLFCHHQQQCFGAAGGTPIEWLGIDRSRDIGMEIGITVKVASLVPCQGRHDEESTARGILVMFKNFLLSTSVAIARVCSVALSSGRKPNQ